MHHLLNALATWRLAHFLVHEDGPADLAARMRDKAGITHNAYSQPEASSVVGRALLCLACTSFWCGLLFARGHLRNAFAYSACAMLIDDLTQVLAKGRRDG